MSDTALVVMARYPESGKTKTRLGHTIGHDETVGLYKAFLTDLAQRFAEQPYDLHWAYTPAEVDYHAFVATLAPACALHMRCFLQQGQTLALACSMSSNGHTNDGLSVPSSRARTHRR